jgi:hypothetical protein
LPGEDANPYLTLALLVTGLLGMQQQLEPSAALNARAANPRVTGSIAVEATFLNAHTAELIALDLHKAVIL